MRFTNKKTVLVKIRGKSYAEKDLPRLKKGDKKKFNQLIKLNIIEEEKNEQSENINKEK